MFVCFAFGQLCGFCSVLPFPHSVKKNCFRLHRTVVLPDFQGVGIGHRLSNFVSELYHKQGKKMITAFSNPALIKSRSNDERWIATRQGRSSVRQGRNTTYKGKTDFAGRKRLTVSFEYVGKPKRKKTN